MKLKTEQSMLDFGARFAREFLGGSDDSGGSVYDSVADSASDLPSDSVATSGSDRSSETPVILELIGDVGTGKTTFTRGLARGLGLKEPVTSPSFTISKAYALPDGRTLVHYDFYRLGDPGLMVDDLTENLRNPKNIVVIEWGESVKNFLPEDHYVLNFSYNDDGSHEVEISDWNLNEQSEAVSQDSSSDTDTMEELR